MLLAKTIIKIILMTLFFVCLFQMPYGFYQFLRLSSFVLFGVLVYAEYKQGHYIQTTLCVCSALLFNPILPVYFEREIWQGIDKIMAALLLLWILVDAAVFIASKRKGQDVGYIEEEEETGATASQVLGRPTVNGKVEQVISIFSEAKEEIKEQE